LPKVVGKITAQRGHKKKNIAYIFKLAVGKLKPQRGGCVGVGGKFSLTVDAEITLPK